ncbi:MAG: S8 family peptidase [Bacteroidia bacterium]|nr:S8 family peptidase [Bacteroidia bacterium]
MKNCLTWILRVVLCLPVHFLCAAGPGIHVKENANRNSTVETSSFRAKDVQPGKLVVKFKSGLNVTQEFQGIPDVPMNGDLLRAGVVSMVKKFPHSAGLNSGINRAGRKAVDLSRIYQMDLAPSADLKKAIHELMATGLFEYVEPLYVQWMDYTPNDPLLSAQYHLTKINAFNAWDVLHGDTNVVIGIVDSGTDWDHPDLEANIKYNYADPINGLDDDSDGFVDNYRGWDVSENTNDPMVVASDHGSHVSGCAAAVTDNNTGVASPGFLCRFLPVKSTHNTSVSTIDNGYDGIVYAADHGVDIINCSWGRTGGPSQFEQDVIDYATYDKDVLVIAAAGNDGIDEDHYPSSYAGVISVASTGVNDAKSGFSNYGYKIDVCAPGDNIYSTIYNDDYIGSSGTSMSSPIAAGCAAMIKSRFPWMSALQVGEQLRITCDNIYGASGNTPYQYKLGKGRVNLFTAVTDSTSPGVVVQQLDINDNNDHVFVIGDTLRITALLQNLLRATGNLVCTLTSSSPYVTILNNTFTAGVLNMMDTASNYVSPYQVVINTNAPTNQEVTFRMNLNDGTWSDFYAFKITVNVDYINIAVNDVATSITSKSLTGYNQSGQIEGIGFTYMGGASLLYEMGLMVGAAGTQVSDNVRADGATYDDDFKSQVTVQGQEPGIISAYDAFGQFRDNGTTSTAMLNLLVSHRAYAWTSVPDRKYIMVQYVIHNNGSSALNNLYAGIFADWDIPLYSNNKISEDASRRMGYAWSTDTGGLWAGIKLLSHTGNFRHYAIDNEIGGSGGVDLSDGYSNLEKYGTLSTSRPDAGNTVGTGNDVIDVVSSGPFNLAAGDSVEVAFALIAGEDLTMLQASADAAQSMYDNQFTGIQTLESHHSFGISRVYPNPSSGHAAIDFVLDRSDRATLEVFDLLGNRVLTLMDKPLTAGKYSIVTEGKNLAPGHYLITLRSGGKMQSIPFSIQY